MKKRHERAVINRKKHSFFYFNYFIYFIYFPSDIKKWYYGLMRLSIPKSTWTIPKSTWTILEGTWTIPKSTWTIPVL